MEELIFALKGSLIITAIHVLFWEGMLLEKLSRWLIWLPKWLRKPLFECNICMASIWGTSYWLIYREPSIEIIPFILIVCGINTLFSGIIFLVFEKNTDDIDASQGNSDK
jgi:hypothetical protein